MKDAKTFKTGESLESLAQFARVAADELTGDSGEPELRQTVRVTVEVFTQDALSIMATLEELKLVESVDLVKAHLDWRRDDLRKPINSLRALARLLKPFAGRPAALRSAIEATERHGWTGLFEQKGSVDRKAKTTEGGSSGGTW